MARKVRKSEAKNYLRQAEEFLGSAQDDLQQKRFNVAGFDAIQSIMNANDALTIFFLEMKASRNHREAIRLHRDVAKTTKNGSKREILRKSLDMRSKTGYLGKPISRKDARKLVRYAESFLGWVKTYVKMW
ncbi:MAG: HEPN domain-containing protein [Thermoplasmata archaeon]|nr:HEPN domain-containing protein [Thermoplasmata archaeon]